MATLPQVQLSFGASNGAWDDRELIHACDAAMEEFHAHHPGPGSWLDKVTAAQIQGDPLPILSNVSSSWYEPVAEEPASGPSRAGTARKRVRRAQQDDADGNISCGAAASSENPYTVAAAGGHDDHIGSPTYAPESPTQIETRSIAGIGALDGTPRKETATDAHPSAHLPVQSPPIPPAIGTRQPVGISAQDAISYAMTSQYWAGYWMGVAQTLSQEHDTPDERHAALANHGAAIRITADHRNASTSATEHTMPWGAAHATRRDIPKQNLRR